MYEEEMFLIFWKNCYSFLTRLHSLFVARNGTQNQVENSFHYILLVVIKIQGYSRITVIFHRIFNLFQSGFFIPFAYMRSSVTLLTSIFIGITSITSLLAEVDIGQEDNYMMYYYIRRKSLFYKYLKCDIFSGDS